MSGRAGKLYEALEAISRAREILEGYRDLQAGSICPPERCGRSENKGGQDGR